MRKAHAAAMSSGLPLRRTGVAAMDLSMSPRKPLSAAARSIGVSMKPGGTALTVMPLGPYSSANVFVSPFTADFAATYGAMYWAPECVLDEEMLTMRPQP